MKLDEFVDEVYASYERDKDTNYVFLLGAGCSKSSGIPLAGELAIQWFFKLKTQVSTFKAFFGEHIKDTSIFEEAQKVATEEDISDDLYDVIIKLYFPLFEKLFPDMIDRQKEIQRLTEGKYPGLGYYNLAELMKKKAFNVVITTNFDDLVYDALLYSGQNKRARVISHHHLAQFIDRGDTPHIVKLHGDAHLHPFNDKKNTQEIEGTLADSVQTLLTNTKLIVIGYGGGDKSIAKLLKSVARQATVYWCNVETPEKTKLKKWWKNLPHKQHVKEFDFDKIMNSIGDKFKLDAPNFEKFSHQLKRQYDESFTKESEEAIAENDIAELKMLISQSLRAAEYDKGLRLAIEAKKLIEKEDTHTSEEIVEMNNNIGHSYAAMGDYDKAIELLKKSLEINLGEDHPFTTSSYNTIGFAWNNKGEYDKAIKYYERALKIKLATLGEDHPSTATSYNNIGLAWNNKGEYDKAIEYYERALKIRLATLGENHPDTATSYNNIGLAWNNKGEYDKAIEYYEKDLKICLSTLEENHPNIATSYNNIGLAWNNKGEYDKAIKYYERALKIRLATLGENHPDTATLYNNMGSIWDSKGEYDKAIEYYERALKILHKIFPTGHPYIDIATKSLKSVKESLKNN